MKHVHYPVKEQSIYLISSREQNGDEPEIFASVLDEFILELGDRYKKISHTP